MSETAVALEGVCKSFGALRVLDGVQLDVRRGETFVILGQSGTGKSVILKILSGLLEPDAGDVRIFGESIRGREPEDRRRILRQIGFLFQQAALFDSLNVLENVGFADIEAGMSPDAVGPKVAEKLKQVRLPGTERKFPSELSGGMRKRVGLARAIAGDPPILLYDEPTTGLDPVTATAINMLIRDLQKSLGVTGIVVTHDMASAKYVGDRFGFLHHGRIHCIGTPQEFDHSPDPVVRQFVRGDADGPLTEM